MEASNIKAMREALKQIHDRVNSLDEDCGVDPVEVRDIARAALSAPPRNCDVGTPEEQVKRFNKFCFPIKCSECQLHTNEDLHDCIFRWLQMPYEEGGEK